MVVMRHCILPVFCELHYAVLALLGTFTCLCMLHDALVVWFMVYTELSYMVNTRITILTLVVNIRHGYTTMAIIYLFNYEAGGTKARLQELYRKA